MNKRELKRENKHLHAADPAHNSIVAATQRVLYRTLNPNEQP